MGLLTSKYRTGVLTDFSIVSKAMFYIMEKSSGLLSGNSYTRVFSESPLPVQVNPTDLRFTYGKDDSNPVYRSGINWPSSVDENIPTVVMPDSSGGTGSLSIELKYDVYDEYFVRTMDGLLTSGLLGTNSNEMSLSGSATSLKKLTEYAGRPNYYVLFIWGNISYFGLLSNVSVAYTAFSRWGDPLKASATIDILKQPLEYDSNGLEKAPMDSDKIDYLSKIFIKGYATASNVMNKAALVATQALR